MSRVQSPTSVSSILTLDIGRWTLDCLLVVGVGIEPTSRVFQTHANPSQLPDRSHCRLPISDLIGDSRQRFCCGSQETTGNASQVRKGGLLPLVALEGPTKGIANMTGKRGQATLPNLRGYSTCAISSTQLLLIAHLFHDATIIVHVHEEVLAPLSARFGVVAKHYAL
jgi:hypothetical protein